MKKLSIAFLLLVLSIGLFLAEEGVPNFNAGEIDKAPYKNGLLKTEHANYQNVADYVINAKLDADNKLITVTEKITWHNRTNVATGEIQLHLYANAYKSNNTLFAKGYNISELEARTELQINKVEVNDKPASLQFIHPEVNNKNDSTVAKIDLGFAVASGDSVNLYFEYKLGIPKSVRRFGYAAGRNFFFISQWFPKVGVFENGRWICSPYYPYLNFYSNFGNYDVRITVPQSYKVGATGVEVSKDQLLNKTEHRFVQYGVHDFAWFASDEIEVYSDSYKRKDGSELSITAFIQPERNKYMSRYFDAVKNSLVFFEENIGIYPYQNVTLVDVPRSSASGGMEYPTLFTVGADLFSPIETGQPEYLTIHEFSHQFFYGIIANNEVYEAWLDEGFTSYISTKILYKFYPGILENFRFAHYIPVYGLNFFSYNEIPIIYTLVDVPVPEASYSLRGYYSNKTIGSISDTSYTLPTKLAYVVNSYDKPELMLHSLERYIGYDTMMKVLREYYRAYKFKHPTAKDFFEILQKHAGEDMSWFIEEFYQYTKLFDYSVKSVTRVSNDTYEVLIERLSDGIFKNDVYLYTDKETLKQKWDGKERWKIFRFKTTNKVIAAEVDPLRKNLLDLNFANNSFTLEPRRWAAWSLAMRIFFWVQNALMILGSIG